MNSIMSSGYSDNRTSLTHEGIQPSLAMTCRSSLQGESEVLTDASRNRRCFIAFEVLSPMNGAKSFEMLPKGVLLRRNQLTPRSNWSTHGVDGHIGGDDSR